MRKVLHGLHKVDILQKSRPEQLLDMFVVRHHFAYHDQVIAKQLRLPIYQSFTSVSTFLFEALLVAAHAFLGKRTVYVEVRVRQL